MEEIGDAAYKRWNGTEWWHDSYERLWTGQSTEVVGPIDIASPSEGDQKETEADEATREPGVQAAGKQQTAAQDSVIYLTADSSEELTELKEGETYIIGGICDHNRYKVFISYFRLLLAECNPLSMIEPLPEQVTGIRRAVGASAYRHISGTDEDKKGADRESDFRNLVKMGRNEGLEASVGRGSTKEEVPGTCGRKEPYSRRGSGRVQWRARRRWCGAAGCDCS